MLLRTSVRQERVDALQPFGFTERQARFLVTVLIHSVDTEAARAAVAGNLDLAPVGTRNRSEDA